MNPRTGITVGAVLAAAVALVLIIAPIGLFEDLLATSGSEATAFLVRRYAGSATGALAVVTASVARGTPPQRAALLALATWFGVQGSVAAWGLLASTVGGLAWLALFADLGLAGLLLHLARTTDRHDPSA